MTGKHLGDQGDADKMAYSLKVQLAFLDENGTDTEFDFFDGLQGFERADLGWANRRTGVFTVKQGMSEMFGVVTYEVRFPSIDALTAFVESHVNSSRAIVMGGPANDMWETSPTTLTVHALSGVIDASTLQAAGMLGFIVEDGQLVDRAALVAAVPAMIDSRSEDEMEDGFDSEGFVDSRIVTVTKADTDMFSHLAGRPPALGHDIVVGLPEHQQADLPAMVLAALGVETAQMVVFEGGDFAIDAAEDELEFSLRSTDLPNCILPDGFATLLLNVSHSEALENIDDDAVKQWARALGLCLVVQIPYDSLEGRLTGHSRAASGDLVPVSIAVSEDDYE